MTTVAMQPQLGLIEPGNEMKHWLVPADYQGLRETSANFDTICPEIDRPRAVRLGAVGMGELVQHLDDRGGLAQSTRSLLMPTEQRDITRVLSIIEPLNGNLRGAFFGTVHLARLNAESVQPQGIRTLSVPEYKVYFGPIRRGVHQRH